jgi:DNA-binding transcriptional ArsR family regulator
MQTTPRPPKPIARPAQLKTLASPVRQELLDLLISTGPASIAQLAERLERAPDSLYFHVRQLVKAGLVVEAERRQVGRHVFTTYRAAVHSLRVDRSKVHRADLGKVVRTLGRLAIRDYQRAIGASSATGDGPARNHAGSRCRGWLTKQELARVNHLLEELGQIVRSGRPGAGRHPIALVWILAPLMNGARQ